MEKISDGTTEISLQRCSRATDGDGSVSVRLAPNQYQVRKLGLFEPFLEAGYFFLPGMIAEKSEEALEISYFLSEGAISVAESLRQESLLGRLETAQKFRELIDWQDREVNVFIHPENLYLTGGRLQAAHRGLLDIVRPAEVTGQLFLRQYQALVITALNPKYEYETLIEGAAAVREPLGRKIFDAKTPEEVAQLVDRRYRDLYEEKRYRERSVKKTRYSIFKWGSVVLSLTVAVLGTWCFSVLGRTIPQQERIIESQSAFLTKNYNQATQIMENDEAAELPLSAQYVLAASYVNLEDINNAEKTSVLGTLSLNSSPQELQYWIHIGRGELDEALDTAKILGNKQWILNAYYKLNDATEISTKISGEEKQKLLQEYGKQILEYQKEVGGDTDEIQK